MHSKLGSASCYSRSQNCLVFRKTSHWRPMLVRVQKIVQMSPTPSTMCIFQRLTHRGCPQHGSCVLAERCRMVRSYGQGMC